MTAPWIAVVVSLWVLVAVLGLIVLGTLRRLAPILERAEASLSNSPSMTGLPLGTAVPAFVAEEVGGGSFTEADLRGSPTVALLLGSSCPACERFVRDLQTGAAPDLGVRLVTVVADPDAAHALAQSSTVTVVVDEHRSLAQALESNLVPQTFVIDENGVVLASGSPNDWEGVRLLLPHPKGGEREFDTAAAAMR